MYIHTYDERTFGQKNAPSTAVSLAYIARVTTLTTPCAYCAPRLVGCTCFPFVPHHRPPPPSAASAATALPPNIKGGGDVTSPNSAVENASPNNAPTGGATDGVANQTNDLKGADGTTPSGGTLGRGAGAAGGVS